jgi:hypothetical protein
MIGFYTGKSIRSSIVPPAKPLARKAAIEKIKKIRMKYRIITVCTIALLAINASAQKKRDLLVSNFSINDLQQHLVKDEKWVKFPAYSDRSKWESLPQEYRTKMIAEGESAINYKWQTVPLSSYLEFTRSGNRRIMEDVYGANTSALRKLVLAELAEGKGRFMDQIINGVWSICEMSSWALSAHLYIQKNAAGVPDVENPIIDLGVGNTSALLAWTHFFLNKAFDKVNQLISARIRHEIKERILQPYYTRSDFWWMALDKEGVGVNNWNVWVNYNALTCIMLIEKDPQKRLEGAYKSMRSVDKFINYYKDDGACEEGPSYWSHAGGMLYEYLDLLHQATGGAVDRFNDPLVKNIGSYIYKANINDHWYLNYADAGARLSPDAGLVYDYGKAVNDTVMRRFGAYLATKQNWKQFVPVSTLESAVRNLFDAKEILQEDRPATPLLKEFWMSQTQIMGAREKEGSSDGFYFSAIGGHNAESHNHNDVGTCIVFYNGKPVLIDIGSGIYTRQTFSSERYTIWTMQSAYHNVPLINGIQQKEGAKYAARDPQFKSGVSSVTFSLDLAAAYPDSAKAKQWIRTYELKRGKSFSITDKYSLEENNGKNELHFMTSKEVKKIKEGTLQFTGDDIVLNLAYNPKQVEPVIEAIEVTDARLLASWPKTVYRVLFKLTGNARSGTNTLVFTAAK